MRDGESLTVEIKGLKELLDALESIPEKIAKNGLASAVSNGAAVIRDEAKVRAPYYTGSIPDGHPPAGTLKRSIFIKRNPTGNSLNVSFSVFVRKHYTKGGKNNGIVANGPYDAYYASWVEFGTVKMSKRPYLRPAFEVKKDEAVEAIKIKLWSRIKEEWDK